MRRDQARLRPGLLAAYGALGLPLAALNLPLYLYLPTFYADELGLGLAAVGGALFIARLLDTISDPLVGELSDRWPSRFGRRRPWLVAACPMLILATFMLFLPAAGADRGYLFTWTTLAYLAWTCMILPYSAWGAELSVDYHERSRITAAREACVALGILLAAALPALLGYGAEAERGRVLAVLAWSMAALLPVLLALLLAVVPEPALSPEPPLAWRQGLCIAWVNQGFRRLIAAYLLNGIANGLPATLFLLFVADGLNLAAQSGPLLLLYFVAGLAGIPFWLRLSYALGKHRAWSLAMLWACLIFVWVPLLGPGDFWPFLLICVLSGLALGADLALPASIQADVVDLDWLQSGRRRTGLFFALWSMATKLSLALAIGIAFPLLELIGFRAGGPNEPGALLGLAALYGLLPVAIKLSAIALVWNFPLGAEFQADLRRRLAGREASPHAIAPKGI